jgi:Tfp pilus assembly protein PilN
MAKFSASINLLENKDKTLDLIITWALTIGRALVIIVEVVALGAFLYRFSLDNQLQTQQAKIKQEQAIVAYQKASESKYRDLQTRLALVSTVSKGSTQDLKAFQDIIALAPNGFSFTLFNLTDNKIQLQANATSVVALSSFIDKLKAYPNIESVSLDKIQNDTANATITIGITAALKGQGGINAIAN